MYVLLLTLIIVGSTSESARAPITAVPGFSSEAACTAAASEWKKQVLDAYSILKPIAVCVKQ